MGCQGCPIIPAGPILCNMAKRPEFLATIIDTQGRMKVVARWNPPTHLNSGEAAKARLKVVRRKHPEAIIWIRGEHLE